MEAADSTVSVDLLVRSLLTAGADRKDIARAVDHDGVDRDRRGIGFLATKRRLTFRVV
jgi:hypothetical protein